LDEQTLFVKNLPSNITENELKELSSDIKTVRIKQTKRLNDKKNKGKAQCFAYLEFENQETTEKNYKELQHKKLKNGKEIIVDFVGAKSTYVKKSEKKLDLKRLHVSGFEKATVKEDELKKLFPNNTQFILPFKKSSSVSMGLVFFVIKYKLNELKFFIVNSFAFAVYKTEVDAKRALENANGKIFNGKKLSVDYAFERKENEDKKNPIEPPAKKQKAENDIIVKKENQQDLKKTSLKQDVVTTHKKELNIKTSEVKVQDKMKRKHDDDEEEDDEDQDDEEDDDDDDEDDDDDDEDDDDDDEDDDDDDDEDDEEEDDDDDEDKETEKKHQFKNLQNKQQFKKK
jgi:RNA recognition motif-containing protein